MSKLLEMSCKYPMTELWTDSFHIDDHEYGLSQGSKGITSSPTWVSRMLCLEELDKHRDVIENIMSKYPNYNEYELIWAWTLEMGKQRSKVNLPLWEKGVPSVGRFSIQTSIYDYQNTDKMVAMAKEVDSCGPNMQVKIPATTQGIKAIELATLNGISVMATLVYSVDQAVAVANVIEKALTQREKEGLSNDNINPMCAVLLGMQDDWLKMYAEKKDYVINPEALCWPGVAICKKIYNIFKSRGYKTRVLTAYYRHQLHWSEFIGGDLAMTIPVKWQKRFANSDLEIKDYMSIAVDENHINQLLKLEPFKVAYTENSLKIEDFTNFKPVILTLRYFMEEYDKAVMKVRNIMLDQDNIESKVVKSDVKLVAFDVDGTLVSAHDHILLDSTIDALARLKSNGIKIAIATGRPFFAMDKRITDKITFDYFINSNGGCVYEQEELISSNMFTNDLIERLSDEISKDDQSIIFQFKDGSYCYHGYKRVHQMFLRHLGRTDYLRDNRQEKNRHKGDLTAAAVANIADEYIEKYRQMFPEIEFLDFAKEWYDITIRGCSKFKGIKEICELNKYDVSQVAAFGDALNDYEMIKGVKYGIAMGNALDAVKAVAYAVTEETHKDGIKNMCEKMGWI